MNIYMRKAFLKMNKDITLEDLGYKRHETNDEIKGKIISYIKATCYPDRINTECINFVEIKFALNGFGIEEWATDAYCTRIKNIQNIFINNDLLQAIYNKCKEIDWLDE